MNALAEAEPETQVFDEAIIFPYGDDHVIEDPNAQVHWCTRQPIEAELDYWVKKERSPHILMCFIVDGVEVQRLLAPLDAGKAHHGFEYPGHTEVKMVVVWPSNMGISTWWKLRKQLMEREDDGSFSVGVLERYYEASAHIAQEIGGLSKQVIDLKHELEQARKKTRPAQLVTEDMDPNDRTRLLLQDAVEEAKFRLLQHDADESERRDERPYGDADLVLSLQERIVGIEARLDQLRAEKDELDLANMEYELVFRDHMPLGLHRTRHSGKGSLVVSDANFAPAKASWIVEKLAARHERADRPAMHQCDRRQRALDVALNAVTGAPAKLFAAIWNTLGMLILLLAGIRGADTNLWRRRDFAWRSTFLVEEFRQTEVTSRWYSRDKRNEQGQRKATFPLFWLVNPLIIVLAIVTTAIVDIWVDHAWLWPVGLLFPLLAFFAIGVLVLFLAILGGIFNVTLSRPLTAIRNRLNPSRRMNRRYEAISCRVGGPGEPRGLPQEAMPQRGRFRYGLRSTKNLVCAPIAKVRPGDAN